MRTDARGFTLLEVLVAMMIMVGAIAVLASSWSGNVTRVELTRINNTTAMLLQRKMTEVEIKYKDKPLSEIPEEAAGDFGPAFPQYKWTLESQDFQMPDLSSAMVAKDGGAKGETLTLVKQLSEIFNKSIKEVRVTLIYTSKKSQRELKNSITTYFIDYAKDVPLMPGAEGLSGAAGADSDTSETEGPKK